MYFDDLTKYSYLTNKPAHNIFNVGWLENGHDYICGNITKKFLNKLWDYSHFAVASTRGFHTCDLCINHSKLEVPIIEYNSKIIKIGTAEIRVFSENDKIYSSPNLLFHYITKHSYKPPQEYIETVLNGLDPYLEEYQNLLTQHFSQWDKLEEF